MLHKDLYVKIVNSFNPKNIKEMKEMRITISNIALANKRFYHACKEKLVELKRMSELVLKYHTYNYNQNEFPQLLDAVFTGCTLPYSDHSINEYSPQVEEDIIEIIKLMPSSINCAIGTLRCRDEVTVLAAACMNFIIPENIIQLLLEKGADPLKQYYLNNRKISILGDLNLQMMDGEDYSRKRDIVKSFIKI